MTTSESISMNSLLEAGVHYGHQCRRWNPKMKHFIFGSRNGVHIIDLQKTVKHFKKATDFIENLVAEGGSVLFVGTKRQAQEIISQEARRCGMYFVNNRWLGGSLTNYPTIKKSIQRLKRIEKMSTDGTFDKLTKKEVLNLERSRDDLEKNLGGIKDMPGLPHAVFVTDAHKEHIAVLEARRLGIPVIAITDTNSDPEGIEFPIPGNDDSIKSLQLFIGTIADACIAGKQKRQARNPHDDSKPVARSSVEEGTIYDQEGHKVKVLKKK